MGPGTSCHILAIMGSGETSPTMVSTHKSLLARLGPGRPAALLLETPYGFQQNAADVSARAQAYFARSVGLAVTVLPDAEAADQEGYSELAAIQAADWVFCGPGSPSYALSRWRNSHVAEALRDRVRTGPGVTVLASAAAATMGVTAVPVYEIYKVGAPPHWLDGLDLLGVLGLRVTVIPHYDNAEGGTHDTRYCYLGERRLSLLERELPAGTAILGVDEHTAAIFDLQAGVIEISGRGGVTVRRGGFATVLPSGTVITLPQLRELASREPGTADARDGREPASATVPGKAADAAMLPLPDITVAAQRRFDTAMAGRQASDAVQVILDLEAAIHAWAADTDEDQGTEQARAVLRALIGRLGRAADEGLRDPRDRLVPVAGPLLEARDALRRGGSYAAADAIRDALTAAGVQVQDTADGTRWAPGSGSPPG